MEELKMLIEMVANLPAMALWVLIGFWIYKTLIIGSIYGVIRLAILKTHDWLTQPKTKEVRPKLDGLAISGCIDDLMVELKRVRNKGHRTNSQFVHDSDVEWLRKAIDAQIVADSSTKEK